MRPDTSIQKIHARHIFDSRGVPTIACTVLLACGAEGSASVPSGASTGKYEAYELRDGTEAYGGKGVFRAIWNINNDIANLLHGDDASNQTAIDRKMCEADGSEQKKNFGANAILAVSLACARASSAAWGLPLYRYLGGSMTASLPYPMMNVLNGGKHADNNLDIQEFMIVPAGADSFAGAMRMASEIYGSLRHILKEDDLSTAVGDEGGFAPDLRSDEEALIYLTRAIEFAGYQPGKDAFIALDAAASGWKVGGGYRLPKRDIQMSREELSSYFLELCGKYCVISLEDPLDEDDFLGFSELTRAAGALQIVGDDLFVTNERRLSRGIREGAANAILIKPNQAGTLTETFDAIRTAKKNGYQTVISHRSGETEDPFIADLAVATGSTWIKAGAPARGERLAKYNRLLEIEDELRGGGFEAPFGDRSRSEREQKEPCIQKHPIGSVPSPMGSPAGDGQGQGNKR